MADEKELTIVVKAKDQASSIVKEVNGSIGALGTQGSQSLDKLKLSTMDLAKGFVVGQLAVDAFKSVIRQIPQFFSDVTKAATDSEFADVKMTQALENSGKVTGDQIKDLKKYAETMQFKIGIDDENIKSGIAMLGTFKLTGETIKKTIPALADLAAMYRNTTGEQVSLSDWAIKIGKAEALPELATQLRRIGIVFDDNQISMLKMANEEDRVKIITQELSAEFGGQALRQAETFGGKIQIMGMYFDEFKEKIGLAIINGVTPFIDKIMEWVRTENFQQKIENITTNDVTIGTSAKPALNFELSQIRIQDWGKEYKNDDLVKQTIGFTAEYNLTDTKTLSAKLTNLTASY